MLTLYDHKGAPSPRRAKMFLAEKGLEFDVVEIDLAEGEQFSEAYLQINPNATVPALKFDNGQILTDNAEITAFIEATHPNPPLLGRTPMEKARIAKANWLTEFNGLLPLANTLRNSSPDMKDRGIPGPRKVVQLPELAKRGRLRAGWFFEDLNAQLAKQDYVAGDAYSVADITATIVVDFGRWVKLYPQESHAHLLAWHKRMKARPSYHL